MKTSLTAAALLLIGASVLSCSTTSEEVPVAVQVAPPMEAETNAYEAATRVALPDVEPIEHPNLHNVFRLGENIISGSEPADEEALALLAEWGVKTILSTDGKVPDQETAAKYGMRYVHVPIQYKGITPEEQTRIIKTFRECEGPFFVHCFHGRHRGPAAAALGRLVVDGVTREQALAEMRQWCGTSDKYSGLYWTIATAEIPSAAESAAIEWDFPAAAPLEGVAGAMVPMARHWENVYYADVVDYGVDPLHPDIEPLNEAIILHQYFEQLADTEEVRQMPADYRDWMDVSVDSTADMIAALQAYRASQSESDLDALEGAIDRTKRACLDCHAVYRNR